MTTDFDNDIPEAERALGHSVRMVAADQSLANAIACIDAMWHLLTAKGYKHGYASDMTYQQDHGGDVKLYVQAKSKDYEDAHTFKWTGSVINLAAGLREIATSVLNVPEHDDWKRAQFQAKLRAMVDEAETLNIGIEYSRMLKATADKLATNVLSAPRTFVHRNDVRARDLT